MSEFITDKFQLFKVFCLIQFVIPFVISQASSIGAQGSLVSKNNNPCNITWTINNDSNYRNAYRASVQPTPEGCLEECEAISGCIFMDIDFRNASDNFYICWFHSNPSDNLTTYIGVNAYSKHVNCTPTNSSRGVQGPMGDTGPVGFNGMTGNTGYPGFNGAPGAVGYTGMTGSTGATGMAGPKGATGFTGLMGMQGTTGYTGATGATGVRGPTGPSAQYSSGSASGSTGFNVYVNDGCQPTWTIINNTQSPGSSQSPVSTTTVEQCRDVCLSFPDCVAMEFSQLSTCRLHNSSSNLISTSTSPGTDQHRLTNRCAIVGLSSIPAPVGATGATGFYGILGSTGFTGNTGNTGLPGQNGQFGQQGPRGMDGLMGLPGYIGYTGVTGPTGYTGPPGPSAGTEGTTKIKTSSGETIYVKDSCQSQWVSLSGYESPGAAPQTIALNSDKCKAQCLAASDCVAVDYRLKDASCSLHNDTNNLMFKIKNSYNLQLVLLTKCPYVLNATSPNSAPLISDGDGLGNPSSKNSNDNGGDGGDGDDEDDCVQPDEDILSKPEFYTIIITPPLTIFVNAVCYFLYVAGKKVFNSSRPGVNL